MKIVSNKRCWRFEKTNMDISCPVNPPLRSYVDRRKIKERRRGKKKRKLRGRTLFGLSTLRPSLSFREFEMHRCLHAPHNENKLRLIVEENIVRGKERGKGKLFPWTETVFCFYSEWIERIIKFRIDLLSITKLFIFKASETRFQSSSFPWKTIDSLLKEGGSFAIPISIVLSNISSLFHKHRPSKKQWKTDARTLRASVST